MNVAGESGKKLVLRILAVQGPGPLVGPNVPIFRFLSTQVRQSPVTLSYTPNTHPFDLQAMLGGGDPQGAQKKVLNWQRGLP